MLGSRKRLNIWFGPKSQCAVVDMQDAFTSKDVVSYLDWKRFDWFVYIVKSHKTDVRSSFRISSRFFGMNNISIKILYTSKPVLVYQFKIKQ